MGYYTTYELEVIEPKRPTISEIIAELRSMFEEAEYSLNAEGGTEQSSKWYEHEADLKNFSKMHPEHVFILDGVGEDGEHLRKYFKNGKMQDAKPVVAYEPLDESKLI